MNTLFRILEWFNKKYTAEEFIGVIFGFFVASTLLSIPIPQVTNSMSGFLFAVGAVLCVNFYVVALIQRWYIKRTKKKLEDVTYEDLSESE